MSYDSQSATGYNTSAPADDGSTTEANKVKWSTIKEKLGDPTKNLADAINTANVAAWADLASTTSADEGDALIGVLRTDTGSVAKTLHDFIELEPKRLEDFLPASYVTDGSVDYATEFQAWVNLMNGSTDSSNDVYELPPFPVLINTTITFPESASNFILRGRGRKKSQIICGSGLVGIPVFSLSNARRATFEDFEIYGATANRPSIGIKLNGDTGTKVGSAGATDCKFNGLSIIYCDQGIVYTATVDANNADGKFYDCFMQEITNDGISFEHSSSVFHKLVDCSFSNCGRSDINNYVSGGTGGSFSCISCKHAGGEIAFRIGITSDPITIVDGTVEQTTQLLVTPVALTGTNTAVTFLGGNLGTDGVGDWLDWNADNEKMSLTFNGSSILNGVGGTFSTPGVGTVNINGGNWQAAILEYNGPLNVSQVVFHAGAVTLTNLGTGVLKHHNVQGSQFDQNQSFADADTTPSVQGFDYWEIANTGATSITELDDGYEGQVVTLMPQNGNTTLVHRSGGAGADKLYLAGAVDVTLAAWQAITLVKRSNGEWFELYRHT